MSETCLDKVMDALMAIPKDDVKYPTMPVSVYIQEAENLKIWAEEDREMLIAHGLNWFVTESIPLLAGACSEAQSCWMKKYKAENKAARELEKKLPAALALRKSLLVAFRFAYAKDKQMMARLSRISKGKTRQDLIQDLNDLVVFGRSAPEALQVKKFDMKKLDLAKSMVQELSMALSAAKNGKRNDDSLDLRNRAFTYLKTAVDEICACGNYTFLNNQDRRKGYHSDFFHRKNISATRKKKAKTKTSDEKA